MRPQSAKAKGRRLQQEVRDAVLDAFPQLEADDVRSTSMGASGADLLLSPAARKVFPFYAECKNVESLNIHKAISQARDGAAKAKSNAEPLVVFRKNGTQSFAAISFQLLLQLLQRIPADPLAPPRVGASKLLRLLVDLNEGAHGRYESVVQAMHEAMDAERAEA